MNPLSLEQYHPRDYLSITSLVKASRCMRMAYYSGQGLGSAVEAAALVFGSAIHAGIPHAFLGDIPKAMEMFEKIWNPELQDGKRNLDRAKIMFADCALTYNNQKIFELIKPPSDARIITNDQVNDWEILFALDIGLPIPLAGRMDGIGVNLSGFTTTSGKKGLWVLEYKTSSEVSGRLAACCEYNPQTIGYALALSQVQQEYEVIGTCYVFLRVSEKNTETILHPVLIKEYHYQDFLGWSRDIGSKILGAEETGIFPKNISACSPYPMFGSPGYLCNYLPLCKDTPNWEEMAGLYERSTKRFDLFETQ